MKHKPMFLILMIVLMASISNLKAQTSSATTPVIYWKFITEKSMVDFFYRVAECENTKQVYLRVKNDLPKERVISFTVEITGTEKINKEITLNAIPVAILEPDCDDKGKNKMLRIDLPPKFDMSSFEVKIKLHQ